MVAECALGGRDARPRMYIGECPECTRLQEYRRTQLDQKPYYNDIAKKIESHTRCKTDRCTGIVTAIYQGGNIK